MKKIFIISSLMLAFSSAIYCQYKSKYPDIPIVDVHIHARSVSDASNFIKVSEVIKQKYGSNLAFWVSLNDPDVNVEKMEEIEKDIFRSKVDYPGTKSEQMTAASNNRMLFAASQMRPHKGLTMTADEVIAKVRNGYVGLKFWFGDPHRIIKEGEEGIIRVDDARYDSFFAALEKANVLMTSFHIADPNGPFDNRGDWMTDPVYYWTQIRAFENVVAKYPKLTIVAAHGAWIVCQDAQIDYLRYMFSTYPNLYIDLSATCQYVPLVNRENIRDLYIEYQDRILFGTDGGRVSDSDIDRIAHRYANFFAILETDQVVEGSFFGDEPVKGLDLPREVMEKIYYKNALKLYPGLKKAMGL